MFGIIFGRKGTKQKTSSLKGAYYRTRKDWNMDYVTRSGPDKFENDKIVVDMKLKDYTRGSQNSRVMSEA
jgi:lipopolysaccharide export system protein LptA